MSAVPVKEEESLVSLDGAANGTAKLITNKGGPGRAGIVAEPVIGLGIGVAVILVQISMKSIGAAAGDELILAAAALTCAGKLASDDTAKLLDRVNRGVPDDGAELACRAVVDVETIDRDVILIGTCTCDCSAKGSTGLQGKERGRVVPVSDRQVLEKLHLEVVADRCVSRVESYSLFRSRYHDCL